MEFEPTLATGIVLSDTVIREEGSRKLSFIGSFQNYNFPKFPFGAPPFVATVFLANMQGIKDQAKVKITVRIEESNSGHVLCSTSAEIGFQTVPSPSEVFEIPFGMPPCAYQTAGVYHLVVLVNNERLGFKPIVVRPLTSPSQLNAPEDK